MKKQLLSIMLVFTMLATLFAAALPVSAMENTEDYSLEGAEVTPLAESDENLHSAFENVMVPFVDYMTNTIFTSYDVEEPNESIIWQYVMKHHLDEFREFIRIDDDYIEYIDEKYYIPANVFEEYVALNFVVTDQLIDQLHLCEAYTLDGDEYVYFYQYYGGSGGPRDVVFYHGYKQLTDNTYALYAYTVDMMEPIPEEDMTDLIDGLDYVAIDDPEIGLANYYITGNYEMTVEYTEERALCMIFDEALVPPLHDTEIIVPETSEGDDTTSENEELPFTLEFPYGIVVSELNTTERVTNAGDIYLAYDWVTRGECDVFINWPDEGYDWKDPWSCNPIRIYERLGYGYGYEFEFIDSQETEPWEPGNTYDAQIKIYSMENPNACKVIDVRVTVEGLNVESISAEDYSWAPYTPKNPVITVTYKDGTTSNDASGVGIRYDDEWPTEPGTYELKMSAANGKFYFTINLTVVEIVSVTAKPLTYAEFERSFAFIEFTATFENGSTYTWEDMDTPLPSKVGEHTIEVSVLNDTFTVPVSITVTPTPTTGVWAEGFTWDYDKLTKTLHIKGQGELPAPTNYGYMGLPIKNIVIDDGIEGFEQWALMGLSGVEYESLIFPSTIKSFPALGVFDGYTTINSVIFCEGITNITHLPFGINGVQVENIYVPASVELVDVYSLVTIAGGYGSYVVNLYYAGTEEQWATITAQPELFFTLHDLYNTDGSLQLFGFAGYFFPAYYDNYVYELQMYEMIGNYFYEYESKYEVTVRWEDEGGMFIDSENVVIGGNATKNPEVPVKEGFTGKWSDTPTNVIVDVTITPEYTKNITVENGTATIPDSVVDVTEGEDVVIDVTDKTEEGETKVESVVIGSATVDKITNAETNVEIKLPDATVSFDKDAIGSIGEQAGDKDVTIVAKEVEKDSLTEEQKAVLEEKEVYAVINLEAYAGDTKLTQFGGGKVTISVPFELPEGKEGSDYCVAYIADDGTMTVMPTSYANGVLTFETTHFSSYVVLEVENSSAPETGDNTTIALFVMLMAVCGIALTACVAKRKAF